MHISELCFRGNNQSRTKAPSLLVSLAVEETLFVIEQKRQNLLPGEVEASQPQTLIETSETSLWMSGSWTDNGAWMDQLGCPCSFSRDGLLMVKGKEEWNKKNQML